MQMESAFTTESRSFSGRGSLISNGGSSGVRLSSSGKNLERTRDLPSEQCEKHVRCQSQSCWWKEMIGKSTACVVTLTRGWLGRCSACLDDRTRPGGGHRTQRRAPGHVPLPTEPTHTIHKMSIRRTNKHSSVVKETNSFPLTLMAPRQNP